MYLKQNVPAKIGNLSGTFCSRCVVLLIAAGEGTTVVFFVGVARDLVGKIDVVIVAESSM